MLNERIRDQDVQAVRSILSAEGDHRVANSLAMVGSLLRHQARQLERSREPVTAADAAAILAEVASKIEAVGRLHRLLSRPSCDGTVDLAAYLSEVCAALAEPIANTTVIDVRADACALPAKQGLAAGLIVTELVTNALKYAHPSGVAGRIVVSCTPGVDGGLVLAVSDDGVGFPEGVDPDQPSHFGLQLVRVLAIQLGATLRFDSSPLGLTVSVLIPKRH